MILRTRFTNGEQVNTDLGKEYVLTQKEVSPDQYEAAEKTCFGKSVEEFKGMAHGFITYDNGKEIIPLYKGFDYYVLAESGVLFADLTFK